MKRTLSLVALLLAVLCAPAAPAFAQSDCTSQYQEGDYEGAALCFMALEEQGHHNGHLLYNLGNAWYRAGRIGEAVLAYRRAQLYLPRDGDLAANLRSAREKTRDDLAPPDSRGELSGTLLLPYDRLAPGELCWLGAIAWALFLLLCAVRLWRPIPAINIVLPVVGLVAMLGLSGAVARSLQMANQPLGVVLTEEVTLRSGRDVQSVDLARLHEGAELSVLELDDSWIQVELSSGVRGWLSRDVIGLVRPTRTDR